MTRIALVDGAWIQRGKDRFHLERRHEDRMEWRSRTTLTHQVFTDVELQREIAAGKVKLFNGIGREPKDGKASRVHGARGATDADREEARRKLVYVLALRSAGIPGEGKTPADWEGVIDAVYQDQGRTWFHLRGSEERRARTVEKPCLKSVRNWVGQAGDPPKLEKLISRHRHKGRYDDRLDQGLRQLIGEMIEEHYLRRPAITLDDLKTRIEGRMPAFNEDRKEKGLDPLKAPGETAIQSSIDGYPKDMVLRMRYGEMAAFLRYGSGEAQADPEAPLDRVELDATRMDLFVVDPETMLPIGRPWLVVVLDRCTRMVLGWFVTFEPPSVLALMQALRNAMLFKDYLDELKAQRGWVINRACETFGVPRVLVVDRARENIAEHVARFAVRAGINRVEIMAGKKPWLKGAVERVIKTISEKLLHPTRGTTFHNVLKRMGYNPQKDAVCTPDDLDYGLHKFFIDVYPYEERRSLNGRQAIKVWREKTELHPIDSVGHIDEVAHLFGRTDTAKPGRHGISAHSMQYFSKELLDIQSNDLFAKALAKQGGKLEFHTDPACIDTIHVRMPHEDRVIPVRVARKWTEYARGLSLWHHRKIREYIRAETRGDADELLRAKLELIEIMRGSAVAKRGKISARQFFMRMEGVQRVAPAGTSSSNMVPGSGAHDAARRAGAPVPSNDEHDHAQEDDPHDAGHQQAGASPANLADATGGAADQADVAHAAATADTYVPRRPRKRYKP